MNDGLWFRKANLPVIEKLYAANGVAGSCRLPILRSPHCYDKPKREATYGWMERWLHGRPDRSDEGTQGLKPFPAKRIQSLAMDVPSNKHISESGGWGGCLAQEISRRSAEFTVGGGTIKSSAIAKPAEWRGYREQMTARLEDLLGQDGNCRTTPPAPPAAGRMRFHNPENSGDLTSLPWIFPAKAPCWCRRSCFTLRMTKARSFRSW